MLKGGGEDLLSLCRYFESRVTRSETTPGGRKMKQRGKAKPKRSSIAI